MTPNYDEKQVLSGIKAIRLHSVPSSPFKQTIHIDRLHRYSMDASTSRIEENLSRARCSTEPLQVVHVYFQSFTALKDQLMTIAFRIS